MKSVDLPYGNTFLKFDYDENNFDLVDININKNSLNYDKIRFILENPVEKESFFDFLKKRRDILFIVSDGTRKTGSRKLLEELFLFIEDRGIKLNNVEFLIATGIHRPATEIEMKKIVGDEIFNRFIVTNHDSRGDCDFYGETSYGNKVFLNKKLKEFSGIVVIGNVGFHYFAGFSGGRKSILPGVSHVETIVRNHMLVFNRNKKGKNPEVKIAKLEGNPVNEDMVEATLLVDRKKIFSFNTVVDEDENIVDINCGDIITSHRMMCRGYFFNHTVKISEKRDIAVVSAGGYPRDINVIQTHKTIENGRYFIREGGVLIVLAECRDGFGNPDFFRYFELPDLDSFEKSLRKKYVINGQTAMSIFEKSLKYRIILISSLKDQDVSKMGMIPAHSISEAMYIARNISGNKIGKGYIIPHGATTLPYF